MGLIAIVDRDAHHGNGMLEGSYSPHYAPYCTLAVVEGLSGLDTGIGDSWAGSSEHDRALIAASPGEDDAIAAVIAAQQEYWSPT